MAKKVTTRREWTKDDARTLKTLARKKTKTTVIARKLKRALGATYQKARELGVTLGGGRKTPRAVVGRR
jgi:hypothetical protein